MSGLPNKLYDRVEEFESMLQLLHVLASALDSPFKEMIFRLKMNADDEKNC